MPQSKEMEEFDRLFVEETTDGNGLISETNFDGLITAKQLKKFITDNFIAKSEVEKAILDEMNIARYEGQPTSRLTSLYNSLLNKSE